LEINFKCLQDCVQRDPIFKRNLRRLQEGCCEKEHPSQGAASFLAPVKAEGAMKK
jgi:hypothetical protein